MNLTRTIGPDGWPYVVRVLTSDGVTDIVAAAVIDASGTWGRPNPLGVAGLTADGEAEAAPWLRAPAEDGRCTDPLDRPPICSRRSPVDG